jgi:hypothetical protein
MKTFIYVVVALLVGVGIGYIAQPTSKQSGSTAESLSETPQQFVQGFVQHELSDSDIEKLSEKIAPKVVAQMMQSGVVVASTQAANGKALSNSAVNSKAKTIDPSTQAKTLDNATNLVDKMIASRNVPFEQLQEIEQMLHATSQSDKIVDMHARISAAVNRGELTPKEAGRLPPGMEE